MIFGPILVAAALGFWGVPLAGCIRLKTNFIVSVVVLLGLLVGFAVGGDLLLIYATVISAMLGGAISAGSLQLAVYLADPPH